MVPVLNAVTLPNQLTLPYVELGDPRGTPVILLHGYPDSWCSFEPMFPYLPPSFRTIVPTQRGFGDASRPASGYSMDDFASDIAALMDALGVGDAIIAGHSMGSIIAQRVAMLIPERVRGLLLIGSATTFQHNPVVDEVHDAVMAMGETIDPDFVHEFQASMFTRPVPPDFFTTLIAESLKAPAFVWRQALEGIRAADFASDLPKITASTIVAWGDEDPLCSRAEQEALLASIPNSRLAVYHGLGHGLNWEEPQAMVEHLISLSEHTPR